MQPAATAPPEAGAGLVSQQHPPSTEPGTEQSSAIAADEAGGAQPPASDSPETALVLAEQPHPSEQSPDDLNVSAQLIVTESAPGATKAAAIDQMGGSQAASGLQDQQQQQSKGDMDDDLAQEAAAAASSENADIEEDAEDAETPYVSLQRASRIYGGSPKKVAARKAASDAASERRAVSSVVNQLFGQVKPFNGGVLPRAVLVDALRTGSPSVGTWVELLGVVGADSSLKMSWLIDSVVNAQQSSSFFDIGHPATQLHSDASGSGQDTRAATKQAQGEPRMERAGQELQAAVAPLEGVKSEQGGAGAAAAAGGEGAAGGAADDDVERLKNLERLFNAVDSNHNGTVSRAELIRALRSQAELVDLLGFGTAEEAGDGSGGGGIKITQESDVRTRVEMIFQAMDGDESKAVSLDEFEYYVIHAHPSHPTQSGGPVQPANYQQHQEKQQQLTAGAATTGGDAGATAEGGKAGGQLQPQPQQQLKQLQISAGTKVESANRQTPYAKETTPTDQGLQGSSAALPPDHIAAHEFEKYVAIIRPSKLLPPRPKQQQQQQHAAGSGAHASSPGSRISKGSKAMSPGSSGRVSIRGSHVQSPGGSFASDNSQNLAIQLAAARAWLRQLSVLAGGELRMAFDSLDVSDEGSQVPLEEFAVEIDRLASESGLNRATRQSFTTDEICQAMDLNADGMISWEEWVLFTAKPGAAEKEKKAVAAAAANKVSPYSLPLKIPPRPGTGGPGGKAGRSGRRGVGQLQAPGSSGRRSGNGSPAANSGFSRPVSSAGRASSNPFSRPSTSHSIVLGGDRWTGAGETASMYNMRPAYVDGNAFSGHGQVKGLQDTWDGVWGGGEELAPSASALMSASSSPPGSPISRTPAASRPQTTPAAVGLSVHTGDRTGPDTVLARRQQPAAPLSYDRTTNRMRRSASSSATLPMSGSRAGLRSAPAGSTSGSLTGGTSVGSSRWGSPSPTPHDFASLKGKYGEAAKKCQPHYALGTHVSRHLLSTNTSGNHNNGQGHRLRGDGPSAHQAAAAAAQERRKAKIEGREVPPSGGSNGGEAHPLNFRLYSRAYGGKDNKHAAAENYLWREQLEANLKKKKSRARAVRAEAGLPPMSHEGSLSTYDGMSFLSEGISESQDGAGYYVGYDNDGRYQQYQQEMMDHDGGDGLQQYSSTDEDRMNPGRIDRRYLSDLSGEASYIESGAQGGDEDVGGQFNLEALPPSPQRRVRDTTIRLAPEKRAAPNIY